MFLSTVTVDGTSIVRSIALSLPEMKAAFTSFSDAKPGGAGGTSARPIVAYSRQTHSTAAFRIRCRQIVRCIVLSILLERSRGNQLNSQRHCGLYHLGLGLRRVKDQSLRPGLTSFRLILS